MAAATPSASYASQQITSATNSHAALPRRQIHPQIRILNRWKCVQASASASAATHSAAVASPLQQAQVPGHTWQIYMGRMPLVGLEAISGTLTNTPLQRLLLLHTYVLLEGHEQVWYFDFLPLQPTSPATALLLLTASAAPGELRMKKLAVTSVKISNSIKLLGSCCHPDPLRLAREFNKAHSRQLHLLHNNCSHYTDGLAAALLSAANP